MRVTDRPVHPLPTRRARSAPPSTSKQCIELDTLLLSSVAHNFPWEVLLAICEQADEATLVQLCLVSFGVLEFAGPLLYRHVNIATVDRMHSFYIKPSTIPAGSRLRPCLNVHGMHSLHIDMRDFPQDRIKAILPSPVWSLPDRRPISEVLHLRIDRPMVPADAVGRDDVPKKLFSQGVPAKSFALIGHYAPVGESVDIARADWATTGPMGMTKMAGLSERTAQAVLPDLLEPLGPKKDFALVTIDARQITLAAASTTWMACLKALPTVCLEHASLWGSTSASEVTVDFLVASAAVGKIFEDAIATSTWDERKKRCQVVQS